MARRVEQHEVGGAPGQSLRHPCAAAPAAPPAVDAQTASAGVMPMSRTATAMQNGIELVKLDPGLQSLASATVTPASMRRRASGYGWRVENSTPGSRVATVSDAASAATSASLR